MCLAKIYNSKHHNLMTDTISFSNLIVGATLGNTAAGVSEARFKFRRQAVTTVFRSYLKKRILVQNDAKLMPNVVQGDREV